MINNLCLIGPIIPTYHPISIHHNKSISSLIGGLSQLHHILTLVIRCQLYQTTRGLRAPPSVTRLYYKNQLCSHEQNYTPHIPRLDQDIGQLLLMIIPSLL